MENETHHTTRVISVFDVWATYDRNWRKPHYPSYDVKTLKVGSAFSLDSAERIVSETVGIDKADCLGSSLHSLRIIELPVGKYALDWQSLSEYVYDRDYAHAPVMGFNTVLRSGNALENVAAAFPDGQFVDLYFPSTSAEANDWRILRMVFEDCEGEMKLSALIHGEYTD